ncbi:MAG: HAD family hydrolase, partial [Sulfuricaulis sp.]|nr:HAD family hydrolase [Sulfuricaulis sp.]
MSLAIFDLDNTLLRGDSDHAWGRFLIENHVVDGAEYERENERYYAQYQAGTLDIMEFLAFA